MDIISLLLVLKTTVAFIAALGIVVFVHEYGHYIVARFCGIHAQVFSFGFGPKIVSYCDKYNTRWQIALIPLGGYVKFLGDSNVASYQTHSAKAQTDHTFQNAALWQRFLTVFAGPACNIVFSVLVFAALITLRGIPLDTPIVGGSFAFPTTWHSNLEQGDRILDIAGHPVTTLSDVYDISTKLEPQAHINYLVQRGAQQIVVQGAFPTPARIDTVYPASAAHDIDLRSGDVVIAVDHSPIYSFEQLRNTVQTSNGHPLLLRVWRDQQDLTLTLVARETEIQTESNQFTKVWIAGITSGLSFAPAKRLPNPLEAISYGIQQTMFIAQSSFIGLYNVAKGAISTCNLQGPVGIARVSGDMANRGLHDFIWFIAVLSTAIGLLNLLPVPMLDGGHLVFYTYEALFGQAVHPKFLHVFMAIGIALLCMLMAFALINDFLCL